MFFRFVGATVRYLAALYTLDVKSKAVRTGDKIEKGLCYALWFLKTPGRYPVNAAIFVIYDGVISY